LKPLRPLSLAVLALAMVALIVPAAAPAQSPVASQLPASAPASDAWGASGIQRQWNDPAIKPGDDFFGFVNGKWIAAHDIPADKTSYG